MPQVYQSNDCGDKFLPSSSDGFISSFLYENIQQPTIITENDNQYFVL
jgi:hypothetical protein